MKKSWKESQQWRSFQNMKLERKSVKFRSTEMYGLRGRGRCLEMFVFLFMQFFFPIVIFDYSYIYISLLKSVSLSFEKLGQWRRKWIVVSTVLQLQIGFKASWKVCLNLWNPRWLKPSLNLVISFKLSGLWQFRNYVGFSNFDKVWEIF